MQTENVVGVTNLNRNQSESEYRMINKLKIETERIKARNNQQNQQ